MTMHRADVSSFFDMPVGTVIAATVVVDPDALESVHAPHSIALRA